MSSCLTVLEHLYKELFKGSKNNVCDRLIQVVFKTGLTKLGSNCNFLFHSFFFFTWVTPLK